MRNLREELERAAKELGDKDRDAEAARQVEEEARLAKLNADKDLAEKRRLEAQQISQLRDEIRNRVIDGIIEPSMYELMLFLNSGRPEPDSPEWLAHRVKDFTYKLKYKSWYHQVDRYSRVHSSSSTYYPIVYHGILLTRKTTKPEDAYQTAQKLFAGFIGLAPHTVNSEPRLSREEADAVLGSSEIFIMLGRSSELPRLQPIDFQKEFLGDSRNFDNPHVYIPNPEIEATTLNDLLRVKELLADNSGETVKNIKSRFEDGLVAFASRSVSDFPRL